MVKRNREQHFSESVNSKKSPPVSRGGRSRLLDPLRSRRKLAIFSAPTGTKGLQPTPPRLEVSVPGQIPRLGANRSSGTCIFQLRRTLWRDDNGKICSWVGVLLLQCGIRRHLAALTVSSCYAMMSSRFFSSCYPERCVSEGFSMTPRRGEKRFITAPRPPVPTNDTCRSTSSFSVDQSTRDGSRRNRP